jgi:magnesium transporter
VSTPRVRTVACLGGVSLERDVPIEEIGDAVREPANLVWVDVQDPGPAELSMLLEEFGFHPLALEDVAKGRQRPKVDEYKGYVLVVTYSVAASESLSEVRTVEVDLLIGQNYLVSIHRGHVPALEDAFGRWTRGGPMLREGVGFLVYSVMDAIIDGFFPFVESIEDELDATETEMFTRFRQADLQRLHRLKRTLFTLRRVLFPLRETFSLFLRPEQPLFSAQTRIYFQDVYDNVLRVLDALDVEREMVSSALDEYLSVISNRLNETMRTLTVVSVVVGTAGCVFGAWGMNIGGVPFADKSLGFWGVSVGTIALIATALLVSRRRGWL